MALYPYPRKPECPYLNESLVLLTTSDAFFAFNSPLCNMTVDFVACAARFANFSQHNSTYNYTKKPVGIFSDPERRPPLITYEGCKKLCGSGNQYYAWADVSSTITTWVLVMAIFIYFMR